MKKTTDNRAYDPRKELSHGDEFALRVDLSAIEQKLMSIRYAVLDAKLKSPDGIARKIASIRAQLNEIERNIQ